RHATSLGLLVEGLHRLLAAPLLEEDLEGVEVLAARQAVAEDLHLRPLGRPHHLDELLPLVLLDAAHEDPSVAALHEAERLEGLRAQARADEPAVRPEIESELGDG